MEIKNKIVRFDKYCPKCEYYDLDEGEDPCNECLYSPANQNSQKPINFKEKEVKEKKKDGRKKNIKTNENRNSR